MSVYILGNSVWNIICVLDFERHHTNIGEPQYILLDFLVGYFTLESVLISIFILVLKQVPGLVTLKKLPCVSFAGVDSLDDVKNHTYNELFVSGGCIVSDESILNPEVITIGKIYLFF